MHSCPRTDFQHSDMRTSACRYLWYIAHTKNGIAGLSQTCCCTCICKLQLHKRPPARCSATHIQAQACSPTHSTRQPASDSRRGISKQLRRVLGLIHVILGLPQRKVPAAVRSGRVARADVELRVQVPPACGASLNHFFAGLV